MRAASAAGKRRAEGDVVELAGQLQNTAIVVHRRAFMKLLVQPDTELSGRNPVPPFGAALRQSRLSEAPVANAARARGSLTVAAVTGAGAPMNCPSNSRTPRQSWMNPCRSHCPSTCRSTEPGCERNSPHALGKISRLFRCAATGGPQWANVAAARCRVSGPAASLRQQR